MTASEIYEPKISMFTLALLFDSGWYYPNFEMSDLFWFGLKEGCDYLEN